MLTFLFLDDGEEDFLAPKMCHIYFVLNRCVHVHPVTAVCCVQLCQSKSGKNKELLHFQ